MGLRLSKTTVRAIEDRPDGAKTKRTPQKRDDKRMRLLAYTLVVAAAVVIISLSLYLRLQFEADSIMQDTETALPFVIMLLISVAAAAASVLGLCFYLFQNENELVRTPKNLLIVMSMLSLGALLSLLTTLVSGCFSMMLLAAILSSVLVDRRAAYAVALSGALIGGFLAFSPVFNAESGSYIADAWIPLGVALAQFAGGFAAIYTVKPKYGRMAPIVSGLAGGLASALVFLCVQAVASRSFEGIVMPVLWQFGSGIICGVVATGLMPIFEIVFDVATDSRLNELMNNNSPLIKRLMVEAPGTYHHSMLVSSLAETAAELIGANSLLCKTAGYYHDVGKLRSPMHFIENQRGVNIHDTLTPIESAERIIAHRKDGVTLLTKNKLPSDVIRICAEHHGNSTVMYFYNKAIQQANGAPVNEDDYRYKASKPSSKEAGILMLADCCEAAVRSLKDQNRESIEAKVRDVISAIWLKRDGQLSECPLTARDVKVIEESFVNTLTAQYHERIEYPDPEDY